MMCWACARRYLTKREKCICGADLEQQQAKT